MSAGRSTLLVGAVALVYSAVLVALVQSAPPPAGAPGALGAPPPAAPPPAGARLEHPPIRAAHYFGREWAMNVWNSDLSSVDADFRRLRSDGFDTVALVVPWGEFQPGVAPVRWDARPWARLRRVLRAAERHKLGVVARVGYTWDFVADADGAYGQRFTQLYGSDATLHAWEAYTARLNQELSRSPAFRFAFLTWEDFWGPVFAADEARTRAQRVRLARATGFTRWVRRRASLARLSRLYGEPLERWGDVGVPPRDAPGYALFLEFVDETLVSRIYGRAHRHLPKLSLEARIDRDRVVLRAGGDAFRYYRHARQFRLPGAPFVTTYFAPAIGARNERDTDPAIAVLARMDAFLGQAVIAAGGKAPVPRPIRLLRRLPGQRTRG